MKKVSSKKVTLSEKVSYAHDGKQHDSDFVVLYPPTYKHIKYVLPLKQAFFRASRAEATQDTGLAPQRETSSDESGHDDIDDTAIIAALYSSDVNMDDVMQNAAELFCAPGIALIGDEAKLEESLLEKLSVDDLENMLGEYMVNFILRSFLERLKKA